MALWPTNAFLIDFGQQWTSVAQRNKLYQALDTQTVINSMLVSVFSLDLLSIKIVEYIQACVIKLKPGFEILKPEIRLRFCNFERTGKHMSGSQTRKLVRIVEQCIIFSFASSDEGFLAMKCNLPYTQNTQKSTDVYQHVKKSCQAHRRNARNL